MIQIRGQFESIKDKSGQIQSNRNDPVSFHYYGSSRDQAMSNQVKSSQGKSDQINSDRVVSDHVRSTRNQVSNQVRCCLIKSNKAILVHTTPNQVRLYRIYLGLDPIKSVQFSLSWISKNTWPNQAMLSCIMFGQRSQIILSQVRLRQV